MSSLTSLFYDRMMAGTERACLAAWREEVLASAKGEVLEVGAGTGANLSHYPQGVERVRLAEPDPDMRVQLEQKARRTTGFKLEVCDHTMEKLPYDDAAFDAVVCTLVMCSVKSPTKAMAEVVRVLKPGGTLGLVAHRGTSEMVGVEAARSGYLAESEALRLAAAAGFEFVEKSEINANPKDTRDHPKGVWTLPPSFRAGDVDRDKYAAIGESDRMTMKFRKP